MKGGELRLGSPLDSTQAASLCCCGRALPHHRADANGVPAQGVVPSTTALLVLFF